MDNEMTVAKEDEFKECLELCQNGVTMCRIKTGRLLTPRKIYVNDQKWLCYHSAACWKFVPLKFKSGKLLIFQISLLISEVKCFVISFFFFVNLPNLHRLHFYSNKTFARWYTYRYG